MMRNFFILIVAGVVVRLFVVGTIALLSLVFSLIWERGAALWNEEMGWNLPPLTFLHWFLAALLLYIFAVFVRLIFK